MQASLHEEIAAFAVYHVPKLVEYDLVPIWQGLITCEHYCVNGDTIVNSGESYMLKDSEYRF